MDLHFDKGYFGNSQLDMISLTSLHYYEHAQALGPMELID